MTPEIQRKYAHLVLETTPGPHNHMMRELAERVREPRLFFATRTVTRAQLEAMLTPTWPEFVERAERAYVESTLTGTGWFVTPPFPKG
jgi:hypothetical protein